jgi:hypothetical protein
MGCIAGALPALVSCYCPHRCIVDCKLVAKMPENNIGWGGNS